MHNSLTGSFSILVNERLQKKKSQILALSTALYAARSVKWEYLRENFLCSFTFQILRYMRRIRNSAVITNGMGSAERKSPDFPHDIHKNCPLNCLEYEYSCSLKLTPCTFVYCPCALWTVQTPNIAEQATPKRQ
jgi:hypothetical protein